ncbi:MAG: response regulator [Acidobacteriota bacterium]
MAKPAVLVIEDEPLLRRVIVRMIAGAFDAEVHGSAGSALARIRDGATFAVVLSDVHLQDMDVSELLSTLERERPELARRTLFMTGGETTAETTAFIDDLERRHRLLRKPFTREELMAALTARASTHS